MRPRTRPIRAAILCAGATLILAGVPATAQAHAIIASSQPEAGQEVGTAPGVVVLEFTEPLNVRLSRATVTDPSGQAFAGGASGDQEIRVALRTNAPGVYTVRWVSVSTLDGHAVRGSFQFGVGVSPGTGPMGIARTAPGGDDLAIAAARWVEYVSLLIALGMLLLRRLARGRPGLQWVRPRLWIPLAAALASGLAVVGSEAFSAAGGPSMGALASYLTTGLPGLARLGRLGLEALALAAALLEAPTVWVWVTAGVVALAASGHGAAIHPAWWGVTVDAAHLIAAGVWAGGILALASLRPPEGWRSAGARELLVRFSPPALAAFGLTVAFGAVQAIQELGTVHALVDSSYGQVLLVKMGTIALMVPLSAVAWRLRRPHLRFEGTLAVMVVAAAAILAAFPIPPGRLVEQEAARRATPSTSAIPTPGKDLTMGGHAGQVLVGLTIRPAQPGSNEILLYVLPLEGNLAAAEVEPVLTVGRAPLPITACGDTCRGATADLRGEEAVTVRIAGPKGGTATFEIPTLPVPDGSALLEGAQQRMHRLGTYRLFESLSSGSAAVTSRYAFQAPDRMESTVNGRSQAVWIAHTRYTRDRPGDRWQVEKGGPSIPVPSFIWDYFKPFVDPRILGAARVDGEQTMIVSFAGGRGGTPIWFRMWIDSRGLVRRAEMRAPGHFMDHTYYGFDARFTITPPADSP